MYLRSIKCAVVLLFFLLLINDAMAQRRGLPCGSDGVQSDTNFLLSMARIDQNPMYRVMATTRMIKVYIHVMRNDDGTGAAATQAQIDDEFADLQADYAADNLCFYLAGVDFINDFDLNHNFNADEDPNSQWDPYQAGGCLNIFYVRRILGENTSCSPSCGIGGVALGGIPGSFCLVDDGNIDDHTISHEVGHCLGLYHTFARSGQGRECINGSNSLIAGDLVADTRADPYSWNASACYSETSSGCGYNGSCTDPCGSTNYSPPYNNIMSYWSGNCVTQFFSNGQFTRINSVIDNNSEINALAAPSSLTLSSANRTSGYIIRAAINTLTVGTDVNITNTALGSFGGTEVVLTPGFRAAPSGTGETIIKHSGCF
jgi:hypothetical protein